MHSIAGILLSAAAGLLQIPAGQPPDVDGLLATGEWDNALQLTRESGTVFVRRSGRALCFAFDVRRPYRGERIDIWIGDSDGKRTSLYMLRPAVHGPKYPYLPFPAVLVRRAPWREIANEDAGPSTGLIFRARALDRADGWTAECMLSTDPLGLTQDAHGALYVELVPAGQDAQRLVFTPLPKGRIWPSAWPVFAAPWPRKKKAAALETPAEDARRKFEFLAWKDLRAASERRLVMDPVITGVTETIKDNDGIAAVLGRLKDALAADAHDFFAHLVRLRVLRKANRLEQAAQEYDAFVGRFERAGDLKPVLLERYHLLSALARFEDAARAARRLGIESFEKSSRAGAEAWRKEQEAHKREAQKDDLPRIAFETSQGRIVIELLEDDAPNATANILTLVSKGVYDGTSFHRVIGGFMAQGGDPETAGEPRLRYGLATQAHGRLHWRGTMSMANSGENTECSQFFLTTVRTPWLDGKHTVVGRVIEGQQAVDALQKGDEIKQAIVLRKRDHEYKVAKAWEG